MTQFEEKLWSFYREIITTEIMETEGVLKWLKEQIQPNQLSKEMREKVLSTLFPILIESLSRDEELKKYKTIIFMAPLAKEILKMLEKTSSKYPKSAEYIEEKLKKKLVFTDEDSINWNRSNLFIHAMTSSINGLLAEGFILPTDSELLRPPLYISPRGKALLEKLELLEKLRLIYKESNVKQRKLVCETSFFIPLQNNNFWRNNLWDAIMITAETLSNNETENLKITVSRSPKFKWRLKNLKND